MQKVRDAKMVAITRGMAQTLFNEGTKILIMPNNLKPTSYTWKKLATWVASTGEKDEFTKLCELIRFYNCDAKNGMELAFYAKEVNV